MVTARRIESDESLVILSSDAIQNSPTTTHELAMSVVPQHTPRHDKASQILGVPRSSIAASRSATMPSRHPPPPPHTPQSTLASLYVVSGLPKSPHTWNLADNDSTVGLHHSDGAVNRFWRAEVLGHTVSAGVGGRRKKRGGAPEVKGPGALSKQEVGKMLSKTLKVHFFLRLSSPLSDFFSSSAQLSFTREVEIIASTLQPPSTVHSFTFSTPNASGSSPFVRGSLLTDNRISGYSTSASVLPYSHGADPFAAPTSSVTYLGLPKSGDGPATPSKDTPSTTWYGVCLTVWSHADAERSAAIRRTLEAAHNARSRTESAHSVTSAKLRSLRAERKRRGQTLQANPETTEADTDADGISESEYETASIKGPGQSTLFLPGDTVFWLPYALTLVSKHPIYDLMRDYLTLSWARFSKDVAAHTLQISKILACPAPRAGDIIRLDASAKEDEGQNALEIVARFPGGMDFGKGLIDTNFTMWPLFKALSLDNIITLCELAMAPTGRVLFLSRYPAMLGVGVYLSINRKLIHNFRLPWRP
jgi:nicotinamide N-methyltransferase